MNDERNVECLRACDGSCGDFCCTNLVRTTTTEEADRLTRLADERGVTLTFEEGIWWTLRLWVDLPCPFYVSGRCSIYEDRPMTCRQWTCGDCGPLDLRVAHARETFKRERNAENGWIRFEPPVE